MADIDIMTAVDYNGVPIKLGDYVNIYGCKVVGLRADVNNRFNVLIQPNISYVINTIDPDNPLKGLPDFKAILVSGYNLWNYGPGTLEDTSAKRNEDFANIDKLQKEREAAPPKATELPSNFLAPSLE